MGTQPKTPVQWWLDPTGEPPQGDPRRQIIGRRIEYLRQINQETRRQLADVVGVTVPAIKLWEEGTTKPSTDNFMEVALHYGVSVDYVTCVDFHRLSDTQMRKLSAAAIEGSPYGSTRQQAARSRRPTR